MSCTKSPVKVVCFIQYVCSWINDPILIVFSQTLTARGINIYRIPLNAALVIALHCTSPSHTNRGIHGSSVCVSNTHTTQTVASLIVTQETDTCSGREDLSGEFVKWVLGRGYRRKPCSLKEAKIMDGYFYKLTNVLNSCQCLYKCPYALHTTYKRYKK